MYLPEVLTIVYDQYTWARFSMPVLHRKLILFQSAGNFQFLLLISRRVPNGFCEMHYLTYTRGTENKTLISSMCNYSYFMAALSVRHEKRSFYSRELPHLTSLSEFIA